MPPFIISYSCKTISEISLPLGTLGQTFFNPPICLFDGGSLILSNLKMPIWIGIETMIFDKLFCFKVSDGQSDFGQWILLTLTCRTQRL